MWLATAISPRAINVISGNTSFAIDVCSGGISRNPLEGILAKNAETLARVPLRFVRDFEPRHGTA